jgi:hypothetical protein
MGGKHRFQQGGQRAHLSNRLELWRATFDVIEQVMKDLMFGE